MLLAATAVLAAACSGTRSPGPAPDAGARSVDRRFRLGITEPVAIDPANVQETDGESVTKAIFEGLVTVDPDTSEIGPGVAERWDRNPDCTAWTFHLRAGTRFSNGEGVTAESFVRGMTRAAAGAAASDTAAFMSDVEGYDAVHGRPGTPPTATVLSGVSARDENTLVVRLSRPNCELDKKTVQPVFSPVPASAGAFRPGSPYGDMPIGNGPFKMKEPWRHDRRITLVRNDRYSGTKPYLDEVDFTILPATNAQDLEYRGFKAGDFDYARIPPAFLEQAKATYEPRHEFIAESKYGVNFLVPDVRNPPLADVRARRAVSLAIDRDAVIAGLFKGFQTKATALVPPPLVRFHQAGVCSTCERPDPELARRLARQGGMPPGTGLDLSFNTGGGNEGWVQAAAQQLHDVLGLDVHLHAYPMRELLEREVAPDASGLFRAAWAADYPSADDFLRPLLSQRSLPPGDNKGGYVNPAFDSLLDQALRTTDGNQKVALTREAERVAIGEDQALIPLWYRTQYRVISSRFSHVRMDFFENPTLVQIGPASGGTQPGRRG